MRDNFVFWLAAGAILGRSIHRLRGRTEARVNAPTELNFR